MGKMGRWRYGRVARFKCNRHHLKLVEEVLSAAADFTGGEGLIVPSSA